MLHSKPFLVFMLIPIFLLSFATFKVYQKKQEASLKREDLAANLLLLEDRAKELEADIANLEGKRGIEMELRSRYDVGFEGEEVVVLVEEDIVEEKKETTEREIGFWHKLIHAIFE